MIAYFPPIHLLLLASILYGLASVLRFSCYIGLLDRPLFVAAIWGFCTGDWVLAIPLGIFFELFFMDLLGAGTYIPPSGVFSLLLCLFLAESFALNPQTVPVLLIMATLPLAALGARLEQWFRQRRVKLHNFFVEDGQMERPVSLLSITAAVSELWAGQVLLFVLVSLGLFWVGQAALAALDFLSLSLYLNPASTWPVTWPLLWLVGALGGILSLRVKKAFIAFALTFALLSMFLLKI